MKNQGLPYISFAGKASYEISGLVVTKLPPPTKPSQRYEEAVVPGVDGSLSLIDGTAETVPLPVELYAESYAAAMAANAWLCGMGELVISSVPDKAYSAHIYGAIEWSEIEDFEGSYIAQAVFTAQPYPYVERTAEYTVEPSGTLALRNSYDVVAYPLITFIRTADETATIVINGDTVLEVPNWNETELIVDSEIMECYAPDLSAKNEYCYSFPEFEPNTEYIVACENCRAIIKPRWRCKG